MDRTEARQLAAETLIATTSYTVETVDQVYQGALDSFDGRTPVAVITSARMQLEQVARDLNTIHNGLYVSIYVRKDENGAEEAEDQLDALVREAMIALHEAADGKAFAIGETSSAPEGAPLRLIDGVLYRVERIPITVLEEGSV